MKYKYMLFASLVTTIVLITLLLTANFLKNDRVITVKTIDDYEEIKEDLDKKIKKIKNEECKNSLNIMLKRVDDTYFTEDVKESEYFEKYFENEKTIINYFDDVMNSCELTREDTDYIYVDVLSSMNYPNKIKERVITKYELTIKNNPVFDEKLYDEVGTYSTKAMELKVIKNLISEVNS